MGHEKPDRGSLDRADALSMLWPDAGKKKLNLSGLTFGSPSEVARGRAWSAHLLKHHSQGG